MSNTKKNVVDLNEKQYSLIENIVFRFIECSSKRFMGYNIDTKDLAYILHHFTGFKQHKRVDLLVHIGYSRNFRHFLAL